MAFGTQEARRARPRYHRRKSANQKRRGTRRPFPESRKPGERPPVCDRSRNVSPPLCPPPPGHGGVAEDTRGIPSVHIVGACPATPGCGNGGGGGGVRCWICAAVPSAAIAHTGAARPAPRCGPATPAHDIGLRTGCGSRRFSRLLGGARLEI